MTQPTQPSLTVPLLTRLAQASGRYEGEGMNHLDEKFHAAFLMEPDLDGSMIELRYRALDGDDAFHEERTFITEDLIAGKIALWTISSNTPGMLKLDLIEDTNDGSYSTRLVFRLGDPKDESRFREEISLSLRHDGGIEYVYSWGVPHEKFGVKSKSLLRFVSRQTTRGERPL